MEKRSHSCQSLNERQVLPLILPFKVRYIFLRPIDRHQSLCIELIPISHDPQKVAPRARSDPPAGYSHALRRIPSQCRFDSEKSGLRDHRLPGIIPDAIGKRVQDLPYGKDRLLLTLADKDDHHAASPSLSEMLADAFDFTKHEIKHLMLREFLQQLLTKLLLRIILRRADK